MRHFLKDNDISTAEQDKILAVAEKFAKNKRLAEDSLKGRTVGLLFEKQSLRTRVSSEVACANLGAFPIQLKADELHFSRGESPEDAVKVLSGYLSMLMARVNKQSLLEQLAAPNKMPIINGLSDKFHPLQALADLLTLRQAWGPELKGKTLSYVGDGNNVCASLMIAGAMSGLNINVGTPSSLSPEGSVVELAKSIASKQGTKLQLFSSAEEAASGADAIYTDVWVSMGDKDAESKKKTLQSFQLNEELLDIANPEAFALHCLPAHRGEEISAEAMDGERSRVIQQAHNRLPATMALFLFIREPEFLAKL